MDTATDWGLLARAMSYYAEIGYAPIEVPWFVPMEIQMLTCPHPSFVMNVEGYGALVGSAEQSFMKLALGGEIEAGRYCALTPCFRRDAEDESHKATFMKVELFSFGGSLLDMQIEASLMMARAASFMIRNLGQAPSPMSVKTAQGWDLEIGGVEVGSYGAREVPGLTWAYGTGVAEPRFSYAIGR